MQYTLVLRKWCTLHPQRLFRCFVRNRRLVGLCQRNCTDHFPELAFQGPSIRDAVLQFHTDHVMGRFPDPDVVVDVYVDKRLRVWLLDFNPWGEGTDSLLFAWDEPLLAGDSPAAPPAAEDVPLRLVEAGAPLRADPLASYRAPLEMHDFMLNQPGEGGVKESFDKFMEQCAQTNSR